MEDANLSTGSLWRHDEGVPEVSRGSLCLSGVIICIGVVIIVLNVMTISAILCFNTLRSGTNYLLFSMALGDLALGVPLILCEGTYLLRLKSPKSCKLCVMFVAISVSTSLVTIVAIAAERFSAVVYPLKHRVRMSRRRVAAACVLLWALEILLFSVNMLVYTPDPPRAFSLPSAPSCAASAVSSWLAVSLTVFVPVYCLVCAVLYRGIYRATPEHMPRIHGLTMAQSRKGFTAGSFQGTSGTISASTALSDLTTNNGGNQGDHQATASTEMLGESKDEESNALPETNHLHGQHSNQHNNHDDNKDEMKCEDCINIRIAVMTFLVVVALVICYLPFIVTNIIKAVLSNPSSPWQYWLYEITLLGVYCNSFLNPVVYTWHSKEFRLAFRALFLKPCGKGSASSW